MNAADFLSRREIVYKTDVKTSNLSAIRIGGIAPLVVYPGSPLQLVDCVRYFAEREIPYRVIGGATNTFFADGALGTVIIKTSRMQSVACFSGGYISASAGVPLAKVIRTAAEDGRYLFSHLYGIPGSVGAAIYNNAGAFGASVADGLEFAELYDIRKSEIVTYTGADMQFSYRYSVLHDRNHVLLRAVFSPVKAATCVTDIMREVLEKRRNMHPNEPSLGSFFKREADAIPAMLIDSLGLKGYRIGDAAVSEKHAGFLVNKGKATAKELNMLAEYIESAVYKEKGVKLRREAEFLD